MLAPLAFSLVYLLPFLAVRIATADPVDIDSLIQARMEASHIPGLAAAVVKGESLIWTGSYGLARVEDSVPVVDSTVFDLASVSKTATSVGLMHLYDRGRFELDQDVNELLPFPVRHPFFPDSAITVRMLLTHTSGIKDNWAVFQRLQRQGDPDVSLRRFVEGYLVPGGEYFDSIANFGGPPGGDYRYCNLAIALAGYLIEAVADSFHLYTRDSVFLPLGMRRTVWYFADIDTNTMAMPYRWSGGYVRYGHQSLPDIPAGTMKSSAPQMARFTAMMMNWGKLAGVRILDSSTVVQMTTVQHPMGVGLVWHRGLIGPREIWGHGGAWNGISTRIAFCREDSTAVVVLCNMGGVNTVIEGYILPALFDWANSGVQEATGPGRAASLRPTVLSRAALVAELEQHADLLLFDATGRRIASHQSAISSLQYHSGMFFLRTATGTRKVLLFD
jgi:CubicO group peptidase (beta-lactamase class C family)